MRLAVRRLALAIPTPLLLIAVFVLARLAPGALDGTETGPAEARG